MGQKNLSKRTREHVEYPSFKERPPIRGLSEFEFGEFRSVLLKGLQDHEPWLPI